MAHSVVGVDEYHDLVRSAKDAGKAMPTVDDIVLSAMSDECYRKRSIIVEVASKRVVTDCLTGQRLSIDRNSLMGCMNTICSRLLREEKVERGEKAMYKLTHKAIQTDSSVGIYHNSQIY